MNELTQEFKIRLLNCIGLSFSEIKELLKHTQNLASQACNKTLLEYYLWEFKTTENNILYGTYLNDQELLGKTLDAYIEDHAKEIIPYLNTGNVSTMRNILTGNWKQKDKDNVMAFKAQLSTFKNTYPIAIKSSNWELVKTKKGYNLSINFFGQQAISYFENKVNELKQIVEEESKKKKKKDDDKDKKSYNQKQLEIYTNIFKYVQKNKTLIFQVDTITDYHKSIFKNIQYYKELSQPLKEQKGKIKTQKSKAKKDGDKALEKELDDQFKAINKQIKDILLVPNTYDTGFGQLKFNTKDGKIYFSGTYKFVVQDNKYKLNTNKILGIDLGITNVATMQIFNTDSETYDRLGWKHYKIQGDELIAYRQKLYNQGLSQKQIDELILKEKLKLDEEMFIKKDTCQLSGDVLNAVRDKLEKHKKDLSIAMKWCGDGRRGHGIKTKRKPIEKMEHKYGNFKETYNHKISRYIVDYAKKNNCSTIQMEDLSGFSEHQSESMLKNWSYFNLQTKVSYKAKAEGINIVFINPRYTSKRCNHCGCIFDENRDCKANQSKFKCAVCGHEENADINAARNIAIPEIDKIITEQLKTQNNCTSYEEYSKLHKIDKIIDDITTKHNDVLEKLAK